MHLMVFVPSMLVFLYPCASLPSSVSNELIHSSFSEVLTSCLCSRYVPEVGLKTALAVSTLSDCCGTVVVFSVMCLSSWSCCYLFRVLAG